MSNINDRIKQMADYYQINTYAEFAKKTGLSHQTASNYLKGKQKPDVEKLSIIQQSFDEINPIWLLTGKGNMLTQDKVSPEVNLSIDDMIGDAISKKIGELTRDYDEKLKALETIIEEQKKDSVKKFQYVGESINMLMGIVGDVEKIALAASNKDSEKKTG